MNPVDLLAGKLGLQEAKLNRLRRQSPAHEACVAHYEDKIGRQPAAKVAIQATAKRSAAENVTQSTAKDGTQSETLRLRS